MLHLLLKFNHIIEQIIILDLICDFHRRIDSVVFILAALDFSNEGYGFKKFDYFRQKSLIAIKYQCHMYVPIFANRLVIFYCDNV